LNFEDPYDEWTQEATVWEWVSCSWSSNYSGIELSGSTFSGFGVETTWRATTTTMLNWLEQLHEFLTKPPVLILNANF